MHGTPRRNAVLVYVSALEGKVVIVPDSGLEAVRPAAELTIVRFGPHMDPHATGDLAAFLLAPQSGWINGQTIALDGGDWLANGAYFTEYLPWGDDEWQAARERIRARDAADRAQRG